MRQRIKEYDTDAGVADMLNDFHEAQFAEGHTEEPEATTMAFYDIFEAPQKSLHVYTNVSKTRCHWTHNGVKVPV